MPDTTQRDKRPLPFSVPFHLTFKNRVPVGDRPAASSSSSSSSGVLGKRNREDYQERLPFPLTGLPPGLPVAFFQKMSKPPSTPTYPHIDEIERLCTLLRSDARSKAKMETELEKLRAKLATEERDSVRYRKRAKTAEAERDFSKKALAREKTRKGFSCPVCFEGVDGKATWYSYVCGHILCQECTEQRRSGPKKDQSCPTCRSEITPDFGLRRIFLPASG